MQYVRRYTDADGETHFEDVDVPMESLTTTTGVSTNKGRHGQVEGLLTFNRVNPDSTDPASPAAGGWGPWHPDTNAHFTIWLEGEIEIEVSDGEVRRFGPGTVLLSEDLTGKGHRDRRLTAEMRAVYIPLAPTA